MEIPDEVSASSRVMTSANNSRCYQGIQRVYRNAVVQHIRDRLIKAFETEAIKKLREPFKTDEWVAIESAAQLSRESGELDAPIRDDFDLLGVNHFFNIFDKHWKVLMGEATDELAAKKLRQAVLGWMKEIKTLRDPLSHPAEADFTREDSFRLLDCGRRVLSRLDRADEADEITRLIDQILERRGADDERMTLDHRLPSKESVVVGFVGRKTELSELRDWFDEPTSPGR